MLKVHIHMKATKHTFAKIKDKQKVISKLAIDLQFFAVIARGVASRIFKGEGGKLQSGNN